MNSLVVISSILLWCAQESQGMPQNVKTSIARIQDYPYFASIEVGEQFACAAAIIDDFYVITSNSCVASLDVSSMYVRVGTAKLGHRGEMFKVQNISNFRSAILPGITSDLAMVKISDPFIYNTEVLWVNTNSDGITEQQDGVLPVWLDTTKNSPLLYAEVTVQNSSDCTTAYTNSGYNLTSEMYCLSPTSDDSSPCLASLGTPLFNNEQLYGVVVHNPGCDSSLPVVVLGVADYTSFIITVLCDLADLINS